MKPLISIGLPVKDGFKDRSQNDINLEKSLNSILSQTYENLEIIISDNCSEDETTKFLNKKVLSDKRIRLFNQKKEISWAENYKFVLEKSSGKYFKWNAADDLISENFIEENLIFLEKNLDFVCSSSKFFYENNKNNIHKFNLDKDLYSRLSGFFKIRHISHNILYSLVRRECMYKTVDISKDYWAVDWMFDLDLLINGKFKTIENGFISFGTKGISKKKEFLDRAPYKKKKIYILLPFYELMKRLFLNTIFSNKLSLVEKISLYFKSLKINMYFFFKTKDWKIIMKKKVIGIILASNDYQSFINQNSLLVEELSKNFKNVYVINVIRLKFRQVDKEVLNESKFPKNFICKTIDNSKEFLNFFKDKDFIALQYLAKNPDFFKIFYLIKKADVKNIMIMNLGNFGNKQTIEWNNIRFFSAFGHFYQKGFYYFFRICTIFNLFPKIDILFECDNDVIKNIKRGLSRRVENLFPFLKISYFRKVIQINSIFYDHFTKNQKKIGSSVDKILYIDTPLSHPDRVIREGLVNREDIKNFYEKLTNFLKDISTSFNKEIIICLHPSNKDEKKYFKNFKISNNTTINEIPYSDIVIFTLSSAILNSVMYKKKIINIETKYLGKYLNNFRLKYVNALNLFSVNIDEDIRIEKELFLKKMENSLNYYDNFIKTKLCSNKNITSNQKIIDTIKEEYF